MAAIFRTVTAGLIGLLLGGAPAQAQTFAAGTRGPAGHDTLVQSAAAQPAPSDGRFLAVDFIGGASVVAGRREKPDSPPGTPDANGIEGGATVRFSRWLGLTGSARRLWMADFRINDYAVGAHFTTKYATIGSREFAHVMVGVVNASSPTTASQSSAELTIGGGVDLVYVFRLEVDYHRNHLTGLPNTSNVGLLLAGVVPFCFRGCRPNDADGIDRSRR